MNTDMNVEPSQSSKVIGGLSDGRKHTDGGNENRLLWGTLFVAVVLLGPSFTLGYLSGYRSGRTRGSQSAAAPTLIARAPVVSPVQAVPQPAPLAQSKTQQPERPMPATGTDQPVPGRIYLQISAAARGYSEIAVGSLRNNGFLAIAMEVPGRPDMYRVLVGPFRDNDLDKARADLQSKGFPGDTAIRRMF